MMRAGASEGPSRKVLVTGVGGPAGRGIAQALAQRGYEVTGVDMADVRGSPFTFRRVPPAKHPSYVQELFGLVGDLAVTWLVPTVAEELVLLAREAPTFRARSTAVFISGPQATESCCDKWQSAGDLAGFGIAIPQTALGRADDAGVRALGFPCLSKPRFGRGGRGVVVHDGPGIPSAQPVSIWQHFLPGAEYDVIVVRRPGASDSIVVGVFEKTALRDGRVGNGTAVQRTDNAEVEALARLAVQCLDLTGPIDIDIRCDRSGRAHIIEINPRVGAHILAFEPAVDAMVALHREGVL